LTDTRTAVRERLSEFSKRLERARGHGYEGDDARALEAMVRVARRLTEMLLGNTGQRDELRQLRQERLRLERRLERLREVACDVGPWGEWIHGAVGYLLNSPSPVEPGDLTLRAGRALLDSAEARVAATQDVAEARRTSARASDLQQRIPKERAQAEKRLRLARERIRQLRDVEEGLTRDLEQAEDRRHESAAAGERYYSGLSEVIFEWVARHGRKRALETVRRLVDAGAPSRLLDEHFPPEPPPMWEESSGDHFDQDHGGWDRGY
jgi:hypothetical protein